MSLKFNFSKPVDFYWLLQVYWFIDQNKIHFRFLKSRNQGIRDWKKIWILFLRRVEIVALYLLFCGPKRHRLQQYFFADWSVSVKDDGEHFIYKDDVIITVRVNIWLVTQHSSKRGVRCRAPWPQPFLRSTYAIADKSLVTLLSFLLI